MVMYFAFSLLCGYAHSIASGAAGSPPLFVLVFATGASACLPMFCSCGRRDGPLSSADPVDPVRLALDPKAKYRKTGNVITNKEVQLSSFWDGEWWTS